jgi:hypothetical protein
LGLWHASLSLVTAPSGWVAVVAVLLRVAALAGVLEL